MKKVMLSMVPVFVRLCVMAQAQPQPQINAPRLQDYPKQHSRTSFSHQKFEPTDTARYHHRVQGGIVYLLPQDGMPCLRPDSSVNMHNKVPNGLHKSPFVFRNMPPSAGGNQGGKMPNVITGKPLVWESKP